MTQPAVPPLDRAHDHFQGHDGAADVLVEYGSYACRHCRNAQAVVDRVRQRLGDRLVYVFRHKPLARDPWAVSTAILAEALGDEGRFFEAHAALMATEIQSRADLERLATDLGVSPEQLDRWLDDPGLKHRVDAASDAAQSAGIETTPSFFINGEAYTGAWDEMSLLEALDRPVAHRVDRSMRAFAGWAPATGVLLAIAAAVALVMANTALEPLYRSFWNTEVGLRVGDWRFAMTAGHWVNDFLMAVFFLVVGLEIKRELTIGSLRSPADAMLPAAAALGGMLVPAAIYWVTTAGSAATGGWGIPMATDIAFAVGLLALLGRRVPLRLKVFLTALAIVDDLGAIVVIAVFYGHGFDPGFAVAAAICFGLLVALNVAGVYSALPYALLGAFLWFFVYASGVHATIAGILLAITVPTRPPPNLKGLLAQAQSLLEPELARRADGVDRYPDRRLVRALDEVHDRIESPAHRLERSLEPWSSFVILPLFALANAGVAIAGASMDTRVMAGVGLGLLVGKPVGIAAAVWLATRLKLADWPAGISPAALIGVGTLAGIGFTMSLFIADSAFASTELVNSAKLSVLIASAAAAGIGLVLLHVSLPRVDERSASNQ